MESEESSAPKKGPKAPIRVKICGVCGDKAFGHNFSAITCESCKAFFRRNAVTNKEFKCPFQEQCEITPITRRFCQKCRLDKCFSIGMLKDYILSDEVKAQKRQKIAENRAKRTQKPSTADDEVSSSKQIKREDGDSSTHSWNNKQMSPSTDDFDKSSNPDNHVDSANNKTVSVIKNNVPDSQISEKSEEDAFADKKDTAFPIEFESNSEHLPLASLHSHARLSFNSHSTNNGNSALNGSLGIALKYEENSMIRSMLTTSPPNEDASKLFAALTNSQIGQPMCDSSPGPNVNGSQNKVDVARDVLQDVERVQLEPKSMKLILCEAIKLEFETYTSLSQINSSSRELNDAERARLNELIVANKALLAPLDDYIPNLVNDDDCQFKASQGQNDPMLLGIINLTAVAIRRLIKMAKKINAFKNMCEEDQVALLKGGCTEMMILRSTMTYDCARDTWKIPHSQESLSSIKAEVLKLAKGNIYQEHDRFVRSFDAKWRTDENIILIMSAIVLFTPTRPRVVHSDVIKLEQNSYYYLLRRYLESIYVGCEAKSAFLKLIQKIMELQKLAEEVIGVYLDVNPSHVEPLLIEIFDLKQKQ